MINLTRAAAEKIRSMADAYEMIGQGVRVMVVGGGCSGLSYDMDFEREAREGDEIFESEGVRLFVDPVSLAYLEGTAIDYVETSDASGFHFDNPNLQKTCGCGSAVTA